MSTPDKILVARIAGAHGIRGFVKLKYFTERPESVLKYKPLCDAAGREFKLSKKGGGDNLIVGVEGVLDRNAAEALTGTELFVPREAFGLEKDELLLSELAGFDVLDAKGARIGTALRVENFGSGDTLEVELPDGKTALVLLNSDGLLEIRAAKREIIINRDFLVE